MNTITSSLFTSAADRTATQLAYKVRCFPWELVPPAGKALVSWRRLFVTPKHRIEAMLSDDMTKLLFGKREYLIVWSFGNVPTETEWNKKSDSFLISLDFRFSPAIKEMAVVVLDFGLTNGQGA
jgi:hypothetical protein